MPDMNTSDISQTAVIPVSSAEWSPDDAEVVALDGLADFLGSPIRAVYWEAEVTDDGQRCVEITWGEEVGISLSWSLSSNSTIALLNELGNGSWAAFRGPCGAIPVAHTDTLAGLAEALVALWGGKVEAEEAA